MQDLFNKGLSGYVYIIPKLIRDIFLAGNVEMIYCCFHWGIGSNGYKSYNVVFKESLQSMLIVFILMVKLLTLVLLLNYISSSQTMTAG